MKGQSCHTPCSLAPCSLAPCSLAPCSLAPCSLAPCSLAGSASFHFPGLRSPDFHSRVFNQGRDFVIALAQRQNHSKGAMPPGSAEGWWHGHHSPRTASREKLCGRRDFRSESGSAQVARTGPAGGSPPLPVPAALHRHGPE